MGFLACLGRVLAHCALVSVVEAGGLFGTRGDGAMIASGDVEEPVGIGGPATSTGEVVVTFGAGDGTVTEMGGNNSAIR